LGIVRKGVKGGPFIEVIPQGPTFYACTVEMETGVAARMAD